MKFRLIAPFTLLVILFSCSENKKKYYGEWVSMYGGINNDVEKMIISKDSISIANFPFSTFHTEKLELNNKKVRLLDSSFDIEIQNDSILLFHGTEYIKNENDRYNDFEKLISIDYPNINIDNEINEDLLNKYNVYFGKQLNSNNYVLQLNDRISDSSELKDYLLDTRHIHDYRFYVVLHADKNSRMSFIDKIFKEMKLVNFRKAYLVNKERFIIKSDTCLVIATEAIPLRLTDYYEEPIFYDEFAQFKSPPPPPGPSLHIIIKELKNQKVISLVNNEFYVGLNKVKKDVLKDSIQQNVRSYFINLYDNNSAYENYLELLNSYRMAFHELRDKESLKKYNKPLDSLTEEQLREMKQSIPMYVVNGISYNDFKKLAIDIPELKLLNDKK